MKNLFIILILPLLLPFSLFAQVEPLWYAELSSSPQMEDPTFIGDNDEQFILAEYMPLPKDDEENPDYTYVYKMETLTGKKLDSIYFEYVVRELEYDKTNNLLYVGGDSLVKVDVESFEILKRYPLPPPPFEGEIQNHRITKIGLSPNGKYIIGEGVSRERPTALFEYRLYLFDTELEEFVYIGEPDEFIRRATAYRYNRYEFVFDPSGKYVYYIEDNNDEFREDERDYYLCRLNIENMNIEKYYKDLYNLRHITSENGHLHILQRFTKEDITNYLKYEFADIEIKVEQQEINFLESNPVMFEVDSNNNLYFLISKMPGFHILTNSNHYLYYKSENFLTNPLISPTEKYFISNSNNYIYIYDYQALLTATSVTEESNQPSILFNNPVEEILHIKSAEIKINKVEILDINGKVQKNIEMKNTEMDINISELPTGIYFLRVFSSHNSNTYKFIKE